MHDVDTSRKSNNNFPHCSLYAYASENNKKKNTRDNGNKNDEEKAKKIFHLVVMSERGKLLEAYRGLYSGKYCIRTTISFESFFL